MRLRAHWKIAAAMTLVALCSGVIGGALALRIQNQRAARHAGLHLLKERLISRLELTEEQEREIRPILDRHQERLSAVIQDALSRSAAVSDELMAELRPRLTDEQRARLEEMLVRRERLREMLRERWRTNSDDFGERTGPLRQLLLERMRVRATNAPAETPSD